MFVVVFHDGQVAYSVKDKDKIYNKVLVAENEVVMDFVFDYVIDFGMDIVGQVVDDLFHKGMDRP